VKSPLNAPLSSPKAAVPTMDDMREAMDKEVLMRLGVRHVYKKGEVVIEEGDLIQRIYMINSGTLSSFLSGYEVNNLKAGDSFGYVFPPSCFPLLLLLLLILPLLHI
jgi:CRP-like cAMP-binding protein